MTLLSGGALALMHAVMVEVSNATLTQIATPGTLDAHGDPGTPVVAWTGTAEAFLERHDREVLSGGAQVQDRITTLRVFDEAGATVASIIAGADWGASTVVIVDQRGVTDVTRRWTVVGMEHESDQTLNSVLLSLNDERAA
jgi:hypothetical protein